MSNVDKYFQLDQTSPKVLRKPLNVENSYNLLTSHNTSLWTMMTPL
jgi:hypothetical protein